MIYGKPREPSHLSLAVKFHWFFMSYLKYSFKKPVWILSYVCAKSFQSCLTLCDPMDCGPPSSSVHGILQARILEWLPRPPPGEFPNPGIKPLALMFPALAGGFFTTSTLWEAPVAYICQCTFSKEGVPRKTWRIVLIVKFIYCVRGYECFKPHLVEICTMHKEDSHFTSPLPSPWDISGQN